MILLDSSAWVEFLRATGSPAHAELLCQDADFLAIARHAPLRLATA